MAADDKNWAAEYILDPVRAPAPSEETGLNSHAAPIGRTATPVKSSSSKGSPTVSVTEHPASTTSTNPFRRNGAVSKPTSSPSTHSRHSSVPSKLGPAPGPNVSPPPIANPAPSAGGRPRRAQSLTSRFPGDRSHRPLAILAAENKRAHRSPSLDKYHHPGADLLDTLDNALPPGARHYHHSGPYDAVLLARNATARHSPVAALSRSNAEALRATPTASIRDAVERHRPLDNTAAVPSGVPDRDGRVLTYKEGPNMMVEEGGDLGRWPGVEYRDGDRKGHGEPGWDAVSWGRRGGAAKRGDGQERGDMELVEQEPRRSLDGAQGTGTGRRVSGEMRRRIGSLRRRRAEGEVA